MRTDYAQIFRTDAAVGKYADVVYSPRSYSSYVDARQRVYLRRLVRSAFGGRRPVQHDFACGTGRVIRQLDGLVSAAHGYDTSAAMLARARDTGATLHEIAESGPLPAPAPPPATADRPALVTVFRLLLNAPHPVRERAIAFAATVLTAPDSGLLVVENHGNRGSLRHLGARRHAGDTWFAELSHAEVRALLARHGFAVVAARAFAVVPAGAYRRRWLRPAARCVDAVAARLPAAWRVGTDVVYVARRVTG
jgi:hypothetical protein